MWNYNKLYCNYLEQQEVEISLFSYKDQRFGCLSRAAGVLLHNLPYLSQFLDQNPHINNKLSCLVRELKELSYLKVVWAVFAAVGIQCIEPFYTKTIDTTSTHTSLKQFYRQLYTDLGKVVDEKFFDFECPVFESVSQELFNGVLHSYGSTVVGAIREAAADNITDAVSLLRMCLPELQTVLARQRRDYGLSEEFPAEYPVEDQCDNINDTPVNNLAMERQCGTVDYRLKKLQTLESVSRSIVLARAEELREGKEAKFRLYKDELAKRQQLMLEWRKEVREKFAAGAEQRQLVAQAKERKRLNVLEVLKAAGGPFTNADEVALYLARTDLNEKEKQSRMKKEMQFARESSTTLPSCDPLFKIQVTMPNKKRRDKTACEFGDSLMAFLGKKEESLAMDYNLFRSSLRKFNIDSDSNNN